jgi:hypothetical protein
MFTAIAPTYDRLNRIISLRFDQRWRRQKVRARASSKASKDHKARASRANRVRASSRVNSRDRVKVKANRVSNPDSSPAREDNRARASRTPIAAAQVIDGRVVADLEDPRGELVLRLVGLDRVQRLDERLLGQVLRELAVAYHPIEEREHRPLVATDQLAIRGFPPTPGEQHDLLIGEPRPVRDLSHRPSGLPRLPRPDYIVRLC